MKKTLFFTFILFLPFFSQAAPSVLIRTEVSPREIYIGDQIRYSLTVTYSTAVAPAPLKLDKTLGEFELLNMSSSKPEHLKDGKISVAHELTLTIFSTGTHTIPGINLLFSGADQTLSEAKTEDVSIKIKSLLEEKGDEGNLRPLKGLFNVRSYLWLWILLGVLAGVALTYLIWQWMKNKKSLHSKSGAPPRPPEDVALEALQKLESEDLVSQGQARIFYDRLSIICREYIERRTGLSAMEKTTSELMGEFRRTNLSLDAVNLIRDLFETADLVKFAKFIPTPEEAVGDMIRAKDFVRFTTPEKVKQEEPTEAIPL